MKYTPELTLRLSDLYTLDNLEVTEISQVLSAETGEHVPVKSVVAKLSNMGVYRKKVYVTKRGEIPIKKDEYIQRIAKALDVDIDTLESLEKVTKPILALLADKMS